MAPDRPHAVQSGCTVAVCEAEGAAWPNCGFSARSLAEGLPVADPEDGDAGRAGRACRRRGNLRTVETILSVLQVIIAVVLIFLVLMHSGKDSGLSGAFGVGSGTGPLGGGSMVERNLNRWTVFFAILFVGNTILLLKKPWA